MLKLSAQVDREWTCRRPHRRAKLSVGSSTKRPAEIVSDCLTEMIAVGQRRSTDGNSACIYRFHVRSLVLLAVQQPHLVAEFLCELNLKRGDVRWRRLINSQIIFRFTHQIRGLDARPRL